MKGRWLWLVIVANLMVLVGLVFVFPHLMVSPGPLMPGHSKLTTDCFACHAPLRGASAERCMGCHAPQDIGLRTTQGVVMQAARPAGAALLKKGFHQELIEQDCMACHSDHAGPRLVQRARKPFSHDLLRVDARQRCESCHAAPQDNLHQKLDVGCVQCHQAGGWKPATFEHDKHFVLDRDHNASCTTCHRTANYSPYTCYGCHEHTLANVRAKHLKEGIRDFEDCVQCHRSAQDEPRRSGSRDGHGERKGQERD